MLIAKMRKRAEEEQGFTLIELLVVILIIGILAAIALPAFLGQTQKAQDANAKSDARNAVSKMETCFTDNQTYANCTLANSGLSVGSGAGQVEITGTPDATTYTVVAHSKSGNNFTIQHNSATGNTYTCTTAGTGGCRDNGSGGGVW
jgi:type IV pilus assembly protein PilA